MAILHLVDRNPEISTYPNDLRLGAYPGNVPDPEAFRDGSGAVTVGDSGFTVLCLSAQAVFIE